MIRGIKSHGKWDLKREEERGKSHYQSSTPLPSERIFTVDVKIMTSFPGRWLLSRIREIKL